MVETKVNKKVVEQELMMAECSGVTKFECWEENKLAVKYVMQWAEESSAGLKDLNSVAQTV